MSGLPPTDRTPIVSMYFSITMGVTTAATIMGVIILRIHHMGNRGIPVPARLRALARVLAIITRSSYPNTKDLLADLETGVYQSEAKDSYQAWILLTIFVFYQSFNISMNRESKCDTAGF